MTQTIASPPVRQKKRATHITVSLKEALRKRPGAPGAPSSKNLPAVIYHAPRVTCAPMWTPKEFRTFEHLTAMSCSHLHRDRVLGRTWLKVFEEKHGLPKCQMMLAELRRRDEREWFRDKSKRRGL